MSILHFIGILGITQQCLICCGVWVGWMILRYFAPNPSSPYLKGNDNEEFELQYLFPSFLRFPVRTVANITYAIFKNVGCCEQQTIDINNNNKSRNNNNNSSGLNDNFNQLVINLAAQQSVNNDDESDSDTFTKSVINNKYQNRDINDVEAKKRQEAKALIEKRLQQIQKEYNQRVLTSGNNNNNNNNNNTQNNNKTNQ